MRREGQGSEEVTSIFGIFFCQRCRNMMTPLRANGNLLEFTCQTCGMQEIDFTNRYNEDCLLYSKELQSQSHRQAADEAHIFDPTMPIVKVKCPQCGHDRAVYCVTPDENETKMVAKMTCASMGSGGTVAKCGHTWELDEELLLFEDEVRVSRFKKREQNYNEDEEEEESKQVF